jgi:predicted DNA-binding transcriptional regulator AlpA
MPNRKPARAAEGAALPVRPIRILSNQDIVEMGITKHPKSIPYLVRTQNFPVGFRIGRRKLGRYEDDVLRWLAERAARAGR